MSFKYINPGYKRLLVKNVSYQNGAEDVTPTQMQSRTGVAFTNYLSYGGWAALQNIPNDVGREIWASCDFFWISANDAILYFGMLESYNSNSANIKIELYSGTSSKSILLTRVGNSQRIINSTNVEDLGIKSNGINHIWLHIFFGDATTGYVEFKINNKNFGKYTGQSTLQTGIKSFMVSDRQSNSALLFSSIIISDEEISPNERIVILPVNNTITDFETLPSGLYRADTASETLLQSVNINSLSEQYGSDTNVTGVALIGNPAYEVDDVIGSLTSLTKENNVVTDHDKITLSTDTDAVIASSFSVASSTTIADLSNIQFGWRAEE